MRNRIAFWIILAYLWVMMILLGAIVMETFMVYPNVFYDPPRSLETGLEFMAVRARATSSHPSVSSRGLLVPEPRSWAGA